MAGLFQVLYGKADGTYRKPEVLKGTDGQPLIIPATEDELTEKICTRPFAIDWNNDGALDLVVGNFSGTFYWFKGEGKGKFAPKPEMLKVGDKPLRIKGAHSDPFVIDWDGDGDLDILSGSSEGGVAWAENKAGKGKMPEMAEFKPILKPAVRSKQGEALAEDDLKEAGGSTRVWVADVNGDGKLDLFVGDMVMLVTPAKGLSAEEFKKKNDEWQKSFQAAIKKLSAEGDKETQEKAREEYAKIREARSEFVQEEMTGFVWLYLQK